MSSSKREQTTSLPPYDSDSDPEADESDEGMSMGPESFWSKKPKKTRKRARVTKSEDDDVDQEKEEVNQEDEDEDISSEEDDPNDDGIISVDFLFENIKEIDYHGVKALLEKGAWNHVNTSEIADALVTQKGVGTSLKIDDGFEVVYGIMSALNVGKSKLSSVTAMCSFLQRACKDSKKSTFLSNILKESNLKTTPVGIIVNERFLNMPPNVAPVLYQNLVDDLAWSTKNEKTEEYKYILMFTKCYIEESKNGKGKKSKKRRKKNQGDSGSSSSSSSSNSSSSTNDSSQAYFIKFEDELFYKHATMSYSFPTANVSLPNHSSNIGFGIESYMVMVIDTNTLPEIISTMNDMVATVL
jgi:protein BCP1